MGLFDSGMVNFIKLLIIIGLISMLYMIVMQKIKEQNHKITSLLSVVSSMAIEITNLKTVSEDSEPVYEKIDISNDTDSDESDSDSDDDTKDDVKDDMKDDDTQGEIDFFEINETEIPEFKELDQVENEIKDVDYKKLTVAKILDIAVEKNLVNREKGNKMKKKDLLDLLS
jgi:hypothetical protein